MIWLDAFLSRFRAYRRARGGHWERWYIDHPVCAVAWMQVVECSRASNRRPTGLCRGTPTCETW